MEDIEFNVNSKLILKEGLDCEGGLIILNH